MTATPFAKVFALTAALAAAGPWRSAGAQPVPPAQPAPVAPLGVTLDTPEYGPWPDAVAVLEGDASGQGRALHVRVIDNATGRALPCAAYLITLDAVANSAFTVGSCDAGTGATVLVLTDRRGLFAEPDAFRRPLPATLGVRSRATGEVLEQRAAPPVAPAPAATTAAPGASGAASSAREPAPAALPPPGPWQTPAADAAFEQRRCASWDPQGCLSSPRGAGGRRTTEAQRQRACAGGDAPACVQTGVGALLAAGPARMGDDAVLEAFRRGCEARVAAACTDLGWMLARGRGAAADEREAVARFNEGCALGDANGCANAGLYYDRGVGGARDPVSAVEFYRRGCDAGYARACAYLGGMHARGEGVAQDWAGAVALFRRACTGGEFSGCAGLGEATARGAGVAADPGHAVQLLEPACRAGQADACLVLAALVDDGVGTAKDPARAARLRQQACAAGLQRACGATAP